MRRTDREVTDREEILQMLDRCDTLRISMNGDPFPYTVPVSFGWEETDGRVSLYFHCALQGKKLDRLRQDPRVCVEADRFLGVEKTAHGITTRYESIIGLGTCRFLTDAEEITHALELLLAHYGCRDYPLDRCRGMANLLVGRIDLETITGKRNLPGT